jgi:hypothetical protein
VNEQTANAIVLAAFSLWPYVYIRLKGGANRFLFTACAIGVVFLTWALLHIALLPVTVFCLGLAPELAAHGSAAAALLVKALDAVNFWVVPVLFVPLYVVMPKLLLRRYAIFQPQSQPRAQRLEK